MSSEINTNGINVNYPIPGQNNSTQGFRNNFQAIRNNFDVAGTEITDLQNNVVLKAALANSTVNNDMANTTIANASTVGFRSTMYNLGNALSGMVTIDASLADVHVGTIAANTTLSLKAWAPSGTQQTIELQLNFSNANAVLTFPSAAIIANNNFGLTQLENYTKVGNFATVTVPNGMTQLVYRVSTVDCGNTLYIEPVNRPYQSSQLIKRTPPSTGQVGDKVGAVCVDSGISQLTITQANTPNVFTTTSTSQLFKGMPIIFTGTSLESNIVTGNTYYVANINSNTAFTVSSTNDLGNVVSVGANATGNTMFANPVRYMYVATGDYNSQIFEKNLDSTTAPNVITFTNTSNLVGTVNSPIIFTGSTNGNTGLVANTVYYIKTVSSSNITVSQTRYNGIAGPEFTGINTVATSNLDISDAEIIKGSDIWTRTPLQPF